MTTQRLAAARGALGSGTAPVTQAAARALALTCFALAAALCACHRGARPGAPCRIPDQLSCVAADRALVCDNGSWTPVPCRGQRGCARHAELDECDDTIAREGDACPRNPPLDYACTDDAASALVCKEGRFSRWRSCRGPDKCQIVDAHSLHCDTTFGEPGDPCGQHGTYSCAVDRQAMLFCDGSTLAVVTTCRGPDGCRVRRDEHKVDCDDTQALEGDACDQPKRITCAVDRKSELVCESNRYVKKRDCRRSDCRLKDAELFCD